MLRFPSEFTTLSSVDRYRLRTTRDHFVVKEEIGRGQFGSVRKAIHKTSGKWMVLKILKSAENDEVLLAQEIGIQKSLSHTNILPLMGFFEERGRIFLVLPLASNGDFRTFLNTKGPLPEKESAGFLRQMCDGLIYCHARNIIHRDIKPGNMVLDDNLVLKICDFGCAVKSVEPRSTFCGTPFYLSPEILKDKRYYHASVDVWALGIIAYESVAGETPFEDHDNPIRTLDRIEGCRYKLPRHFSLPLAAFIRCILVRDPSKRFSLFDIASHPWLNTSNTAEINGLETMLDKNINDFHVFLRKEFGVDCEDAAHKVWEDLESSPSVLATRNSLIKNKVATSVSLSMGYEVLRKFLSLAKST